MRCDAMGQDDGMEDDGLDRKRRRWLRECRPARRCTQARDKGQLWVCGSGCVSRAHRAADGVVGGVAVDQTVVCSVVVWHGDMHTGATYLPPMGHGTWKNSWAERRAEHWNDLLLEGGIIAI